ncbi:MAG: hypothetical protein JWQ63_1947 [Mucilaginibacter sp.]|nr:hypothetical protein [Mucilaginibacter sp.]
MPKPLLNEENFLLNLLFEGNKQPAEAFNFLKDIFQSLSTLDDLFISSIDNGLQIEYSLEDLEFGSIKSRIRQLIEEIPDEAIKEFNWKKLVGHFLLKLKYLVLRYLQEKESIDSKESLEILMRSIENEKTKMLKNDRFIITEVNVYQLLTALEPIILVLSQLKNQEKIEYKSLDGNAILDNKVSINKAKILWELGDKKFENETTEILKVKKLDLLSDNSTWNFKLGNKSIDAKIIDKDWLDKYHAREYTLLPEDSLKVKLKVCYVNKPDGKVVKPIYEIVKVIDIIYPENNQTTLYK